MFLVLVRIGENGIGGRKFSEIKVQKSMSSNVRNRLKFAKISRKDLLCTGEKFPAMQTVGFLQCAMSCSSDQRTQTMHYFRPNGVKTIPFGCGFVSQRLGTTKFTNLIG